MFLNFFYALPLCDFIARPYFVIQAQPLADAILAWGKLVLNESLLMAISLGKTRNL